MFTVSKRADGHGFGSQLTKERWVFLLGLRGLCALGDSTCSDSGALRLKDSGGSRIVRRGSRFGIGSLETNN